MTIRMVMNWIAYLVVKQLAHLSDFAFWTWKNFGRSTLVQPCPVDPYANILLLFLVVAVIDIGVIKRICMR